MAKTPPYPYRVPRGYGYCQGTAACVPVFGQKKFSGMGLVRVGAGRVLYRVG
jgi:hypothetical protein